MRTKHYDAILTGGGAAGLSLAYQLKKRWSEWSMLIIDEQVKRHNDHTWCFWSVEDSLLEPIVYRRWRNLKVIDENTELTLALSPYRYRMIRSIDFYRFVRNELGGQPDVDFMLGTVERIVDGRDQAEVTVNEIAYRSDWIFDSRYRPCEYHPRSHGYHHLTQHFLGWEIESERPVFDPKAPYLFDFRTPQRSAMSFLYVLPISETRGLVEYTVFSTGILPTDAYEGALRHYLEVVLGADCYRIVEEERGIIPMTDQPHRRRAGYRVLNIGTRGGRVKASSGYTFSRIQRDTQAILASLEAYGHPFDLPKAPSRYRAFDATMLQVLEQHGNRGAEVFIDLFKNNPIQRIFRFLDEEGSLRENLKLMATVPPKLFILAGIRAHLRRWTTGISS
jgi:lycopene beta-cyclase